MYGVLLVNWNTFSSIQAVVIEMPSTAYQDSIIGYIDILGFSDLVKDDRVDTILRAMRIIRRRLNRIDEFPKTPLRHTMFSDTVVFSAELTDEGIVALIHNVAYLTAALFLKGIFCRGAITKGQLYHREATIFGPALINAHRQESRLAIYPRIIIPYELALRFLDIKNAGHHRDLHRGIGDYFRHDFDNQYHVDIFSPWMSKPPRSGLVSNTVVRVVQHHLLQRIDVSDNVEVQRVQSKLFWLSEYLEYVDKIHGPIRFGASYRRASKIPK